MKHLRMRIDQALMLLVMMLCVMMIVSCGTVPTATFNDKAALTVQSVTTARKVSTQLMTARAISIEQDVVNQAALDVVIKGVRAAQAINAQDPVQAAAALTAASEQLASVQKLVGVKP